MGATAEQISPLRLQSRPWAQAGDFVCFTSLLPSSAAVRTGNCCRNHCLQRAERTSGFKDGKVSFFSERVPTKTVWICLLSSCCTLVLFYFNHNSRLLTCHKGTGDSPVLICAWDSSLSLQLPSSTHPGAQIQQTQQKAARLPPPLRRPSSDLQARQAPGSEEVTNKSQYLRVNGMVSKRLSTSLKKAREVFIFRPYCLEGSLL